MSTDDKTLEARITNLEEGHVVMSRAIYENTEITTRVEATTSDLVTLSTFIKTGIKYLLWFGGVAGAVASVIGLVVAYRALAGGGGTGL